MGAFAYVAIDGATGKRVTGAVEAPDMASATKTLRQKGLAVQKLKAGGQGRIAAAAGNIGGDMSKKGGVKPRDLTLFSRQFATMVGAGLTILRCLMILEDPGCQQATSGSDPGDLEGHRERPIAV